MDADRRNTTVKQHTNAVAIATVMVFCGLGTSTASVIDFNSIAHGEIVMGQILGITVEAVNPNRNHDLAIGFDTNETGTADTDLQKVFGGRTSWSGGNMSPAELAALDLGTVLIIAENDFDSDDDGDNLIDSPDDEGSRPAGSITFTFDDPILAVGFDLIDIEGVLEADAPNFEPGAFAVFRMDSSLVGTVDFAEFLPFGTHDMNAQFGNNTVNRIAPISFGGMQFNSVTIRLGGSGAVDNLVFRVPAPGVAALVGLGLGLLGVLRRRNRD